MQKEPAPLYIPINFPSQTASHSTNKTQVFHVLQRRIHPLCAPPKSSTPAPVNAVVLICQWKCQAGLILTTGPRGPCVGVINTPARKRSRARMERDSGH